MGLQVVLGIVMKAKQLKHLKRYVLVILAGILLFSPYLYVFFQRMFASLNQGTWLNPPNGWASISYILTLFLNSYGLVLGFITLTSLAFIRWAIVDRSVSKKYDGYFMLVFDSFFWDVFHILLISYVS
jgi:hypothetical protein